MDMAFNKKLLSSDTKISSLKIFFRVQLFNYQTSYITAIGNYQTELGQIHCFSGN